MDADNKPLTLCRKEVLTGLLETLCDTVTDGGHKAKAVELCLERLVDAWEGNSAAEYATYFGDCHKRVEFLKTQMDSRVEYEKAVRSRMLGDIVRLKEEVYQKELKIKDSADARDLDWAPNCVYIEPAAIESDCEKMTLKAAIGKVKKDLYTKARQKEKYIEMLHERQLENLQNNIKLLKQQNEAEKVQSFKPRGHSSVNDRRMADFSAKWETLLMACHETITKQASSLKTVVTKVNVNRAPAPPPCSPTAPFSPLQSATFSVSQRIPSSPITVEPLQSFACDTKATEGRTHTDMLIKKQAASRAEAEAKVIERNQRIAAMNVVTAGRNRDVLLPLKMYSLLPAAESTDKIRYLMKELDQAKAFEEEVAMKEREIKLGAQRGMTRQGTINKSFLRKGGGNRQIQRFPSRAASRRFMTRNTTAKSSCVRDKRSSRSTSLGESSVPSPTPTPTPVPTPTVTVNMVRMESSTSGEEDEVTPYNVPSPKGLKKDQRKRWQRRDIELMPLPSPSHQATMRVRNSIQVTPQTPAYLSPTKSVLKTTGTPDSCKGSVRFEDDARSTKSESISSDGGFGKVLLVPTMHDKRVTTGTQTDSETVVEAEEGYSRPRKMLFHVVATPTPPPSRPVTPVQPAAPPQRATSPSSVPSSAVPRQFLMMRRQMEARKLIREATPKVAVDKFFLNIDVACPKKHDKKIHRPFGPRYNQFGRLSREGYKEIELGVGMEMMKTVCDGNVSVFAPHVMLGPSPTGGESP